MRGQRVAKISGAFAEGTPRTRRCLALLALAALSLGGCTVNATKKHYVLAEKLWGDQKYAAAVAEFEKVVAKEPQGKLGLQALYRAATTQYLFLSEYGDAARKFKAYSLISRDPATVWEAKKLIGEIYFAKTEQFDLAAQYYAQLLAERPAAAEAPEFVFRVARSQYFQSQFDESIASYREVVAKYPRSPWAEKAAYQIGVAYFTRGDQRPGGAGQGMGVYEQAIAAFRQFVARYPTSPLVPEAQFGIANCLEELDQLDAAADAYRKIKSTYPSPKVVLIRLARIQERQNQKNH